jgi:hypothetical protein
VKTRLRGLDQMAVSLQIALPGLLHELVEWRHPVSALT